MKLTVVRIVDVDDFLPAVVDDDVQNGLMVFRPEAQCVIHRTRCRNRNLAMHQSLIIPASVIKLSHHLHARRHRTQHHRIDKSVSKVP